MYGAMMGSGLVLRASIFKAHRATLLLVCRLLNVALGLRPQQLLACRRELLLALRAGWHFALSLGAAH